MQNPVGGFRFVLAADNDAIAPPNTLRLANPPVCSGNARPGAPAFRPQAGHMAPRANRCRRHDSGLRR